MTQVDNHGDVLVGDELAAAGMLELLRDRWRQPEFASFVEMLDSTGGHHNRIDFFAVATWASRGGLGHSIAVEVKASRSDFMRELRDPGKRSFAERVAHECWFAVEKGVVKSPDEIPEGWGLLVRTAGGLRVEKAARQREPAPWPASFIAAFARRCSDPKPAFDKRLYRYAGRALTAEEVVEVGRELAADDIRKRQSEIEAAAVEKYKADAWRNPDAGLAKAVRERLQPVIGHVDRHSFIQWCDSVQAGGTGVLPRDLHQLRHASQQLAAVVARLEARPAPEPVLEKLERNEEVSDAG